MTEPIRVLSLQPYWGGSHRQFQEGWIDNSRYAWTILSLPARHWKWRMRHASIYFAEEIHRRVDLGESWDVIVCTDMLNVADFKGLVGAPIAQLPTIVYFHENQFAYPNQFDYQRDQHFPFTNFVSALAADEVWFNSQYNFDSMWEGLHRHSKRWPDFVPVRAIESLKSRIQIQPPGIDAPPFELAPTREARQQRVADGEPIRIVWAARWEHDKNPMVLYHALERLSEVDLPFQISLIGQEFPKVPAGIVNIREKFSNQVLKWGYQRTRHDYWRALSEADVFVSTANHEFFGLSAAEGIAAGLFPLLPRRLAYPELLSYAIGNGQVDASLYDGSPEALFDGIRQMIHEREQGNWQVNPEMSTRIISNVGWKTRAKQIDDSIARVVNGVHRPGSDSIRTGDRAS